MTIRNPIEWTADKIGLVDVAGRPRPQYSGIADTAHDQRPIAIRRIGLHDLQDALAKGFEDFGANRTDVIFLCLFYPLFGLVLARLVSGNDMLPLLFPLASGFALLGPLFGVGLYEMSRRREQGLQAGWSAAFGVANSPSFGSVLALGFLLFLIYAVWLLTAWGIYAVTLGPLPPVSVGAFLHDVFTTPAGWTMAIVGVAVGFIYACIVLILTDVSFPLLLDRNVGVSRAIATSVEAARKNPVPIAAWGLIVALGLVLGSIPLFFGLVVVLPVLGHATWHLYRKLVV
ncbi:MAG TPA: DUF2189 domain-containing protein [Acetobacteraceae bacterium]|nr:DUF2189 domain-containing protein [Acetobacteraceae bacterium]